MRTALFLALLSLASASLSVTYHTDPSCSSPPSPFPATPPASPFDSVGSALVFADGGECLQTSSAGLFHVFGDCDSTGSVTFNWYQTRLHNPSAGCPAAAIYNGGWDSTEMGNFRDGYCFTNGNDHFLFSCGSSSGGSSSGGSSTGGQGVPTASAVYAAQQLLEAAIGSLDVNHEYATHTHHHNNAHITSLTTFHHLRFFSAYAAAASTRATISTRRYSRSLYASTATTMASSTSMISSLSSPLSTQTVTAGSTSMTSPRRRRRRYASTTRMATVRSTSPISREY